MISLQETGCIIHSNTIRVLHVDDDTTFLEVSKQILGLIEEIEVEHATSTQEAFQKLSEQEFNVVISDYEMPQKNGLEFLKELRKQNSSIPFILFTGKGREEIVIKALNLGADGYVNKHGNPETVYGELFYFIKQASKRQSTQKALIASQATLKENEQKYRSLFSAMNEGVCLHEILYDTSGKAVDYRILEANSAFEEITGIKREKAIGQRASKLYGVEEAPYLEVYSKVAESGKTVKFETWFAPMEKSFAVSAFSPKKGTFATVFFDVTENKKFETALKEKDRLCRFITENTKDVIWTMDFEGHFTYISPSVQKLRGYSPKEVMNQTILEALTPQSAQVIFESIQQANQTGVIPDRFFELEQPCKDGSTVWTEVNFTVIQDQNGKPETILGISRDISERKKAEMQTQKDIEERETLLRAVFESENMIADAIEQLSETNLKLEKVNEKLRVVGGLTRHDVANKLTVAASNLYLLKKKLKDQPELLRLVEKTEMSILESNKIFEFSRLYEHIGVEKLTKIVVSEVFDEAVKLFPNLEAQIINEAQGLTVNADAMLRQLFYNLLENSIKYGQGFTQIKLAKKEDEKQISLNYEDNGVGIAKENKEKIFSEGFTTGGTGLGLKLVKKMIESYGWSIHEEGIPNKGAKFVIQIPKETHN